MKWKTILWTLWLGFLACSVVAYLAIQQELWTLGITAFILYFFFTIFAIIFTKEFTDSGQRASEKIKWERTAFK